MTELIYLNDSYIRDLDAMVTETTHSGVVLDKTAFYPTGGGQPHDLGTLSWDGGSARVVEVSKRGPLVVHRLEGNAPQPGSAAPLDLLIHQRSHTRSY